MKQTTEEKTTQIQQHILDEISAFEAEIGRLRRKEMPEEKFKIQAPAWYLWSASEGCFHGQGQGAAGCP